MKFGMWVDIEKTKVFFLQQKTLSFKVLLLRS